MAPFTVSRSIVVAAPAATVFGLLDDFHQWRHWSPWENVDPAMDREYSGAPEGPGAQYSWHGNRKAGSGAMRITESVPGERVEIDLTFRSPFPAENRVRFDIAQFEPGLVRVTWTMSGATGGLMGLVSRIMPMDRMVGRDFEKGLAALKLRAEG